MVTITRTSPISGEEHQMTFDIDPEIYKNCLRRWQEDGVWIQDAFPMLDADEREFLLTGIPPCEWDKALG